VRFLTLLYYSESFPFIQPFSLTFLALPFTVYPSRKWEKKVMSSLAVLAGFPAFKGRDGNRLYR
jgi:hypothetical protein